MLNIIPGSTESIEHIQYHYLPCCLHQYSTIQQTTPSESNIKLIGVDHQLLLKNRKLLWTICVFLYMFTIVGSQSLFECELPPELMAAGRHRKCESPRHRIFNFQQKKLKLNFFLKNWTSKFLFCFQGGYIGYGLYTCETYNSSS